MNPEYFTQACRHLEHAERNAAQLFDMFDAHPLGIACGA